MCVFQLFLEENEVGTNIIENFLSKLRDYENFLNEENLNLDSVNPKKLVEYTEYLVSTNKESVLDFLRAILSYANYSKKYDFMTKAIDIFESYNAMDNLFSRVAETHGEQMRNKIFRDLISNFRGYVPSTGSNLILLSEFFGFQEGSLFNMIRYL